MTSQSSLEALPVCVPALPHAVARSDHAGGGLPTVAHWGERTASRLPTQPPGSHLERETGLGRAKGQVSSQQQASPHLSSQSQGWEGPPQGSSRFLPVVGEGRGVAIWGRWHLKVRERRPFSGNCQPGSRGPPKALLPSIPILAASATGRMTLDMGGAQPEIGDRWEGGGVGTPGRTGGRGSLPEGP